MVRFRENIQDAEVFVDEDPDSNIQANGDRAGAYVVGQLSGMSMRQREEREAFADQLIS